MVEIDVQACERVVLALRGKQIPADKEESHALVWLVAGTNGGKCIEARGRSQAEAWYRAMWQAEAVGMLARVVFAEMLAASK
jgi:hypothetical protein